MGDTASNLGNAMDELMRHQPSLKVDATFAIIKVNIIIYCHEFSEVFSVVAMHSTVMCFCLYQSYKHAAVPAEDIAMASAVLTCRQILKYVQGGA
jgi:hypothetical protein